MHFQFHCNDRMRNILFASWLLESELFVCFSYYLLYSEHFLFGHWYVLSLQHLKSFLLVAVTCGSLKSAPMIGRQYTSFIMGVVQLVNCVGALLTPFLVSVLTPNNTILEWRSVFFCICFILIVTNIAFCMFCSADPQPWTIVTDKKQYQSGAESIDFPQTGAKP